MDKDKIVVNTYLHQRETIPSIHAIWYIELLLFRYLTTFQFVVTHCPAASSSPFTSSSALNLIEPECNPDILPFPFTLSQEGLEVSTDLRVEQSFEDLEDLFEPDEKFSFDAVIQLQETD